MIHQLHKFRYGLLLSTLLLGLLLLPGLQKALVVDNSLSVWFMEDDPALASYHAFQERFGNDEVVVLIVKDKQGLLRQDYFKAFVQLSSRLEALPGVAGVLGPGNAELSTYSAFGSFPRPLLSSTADAGQVKQQLEDLPVLREQLYNTTYTAARFIIVLHALPEFDTRRGQLLDQVKAVIARELPQGKYHLGGVGILYEGLNKLSQQDFGFFLGIGYLMMFLLLLLIYRRVLLLLYALGTVALATYFTLGIYGMMGYRLNLMTTLLPMIIILLGILDVMHVLNTRSQLQETPGTDKQNAALRALAGVFRPCLFTSLTTMAGFLALTASPMAILQQFGLFAALGILLSLLFTYVLGVILLPRSAPARASTRLAATALLRLLQAVFTHKRTVTAFSFLLLLASLVGLRRLQTDTYTLGYFPQRHQVVQDHLAMEAAWGPYMPLEFLVEPLEGQQLHAAAIILAAKAFADTAKTVHGVGSVFGFHTLYEAGLEARYKAKGRALLRSQFYLNQADKELQANYASLSDTFMHRPTRTGRITISGEMVSAQVLNAKVDTLLQLAQATLGGSATVRPSGYQPMYAGIVQYVTRSQVNSLLLALVFIFLLVWLFIRDVRLALLSLIPNFFPIVLMLGLMGWLDIPLDTATASIAAIALSFCIDDTLHFVYHYRQGLLRGDSPPEAQKWTLRRVGPAIGLTSLVLFCGYVLMLFGSLKTVQLFGLLTATAIAGALYSQLFIFPLLLQQFASKPSLAPNARLQSQR